MSNISILLDVVVHKSFLSLFLPTQSIIHPPTQTTEHDPELIKRSKSLEYKHWSFYVAFLLLILGAVASTTNLGLLGMTAIAPFAAFALVFNAILGRFCMEPPEPYAWIHFISSTFIVAGLAVSCTQIKATEVVDYTQEEMWDFLTRDWVLATTLSCLAFMILSSILVQLNSAENVGRGKQESSRIISLDGNQDDDEEETFNTYAGPPETDRTCCLEQCEPLLKETPKRSSSGTALNVNDTKRKPFDFSRTALGMLYYSIMCGLCSGMNSALLKVLVELIKDGSEHLKDYPFYCLLFILIPLIVTQGWFLSQGLRRHESVLFVPPMTSMIIVCNAGAGHMYFDEGSAFTDDELLWFYVGVIICIVGALIITLHNPTDHHHDAAAQRQIQKNTRGMSTEMINSEQKSSEQDTKENDDEEQQQGTDSTDEKKSSTSSIAKKLL